MRKALRVLVLGALSVSILVFVSASPASADLLPRPWDSEANWSKLGDLLHSGSYGAGDGASIEDGFKLIRTEPGVTLNQNAMITGLRDARWAWLVERPPITGVGFAAYGGAFLLGLVVGTELNKTLLHIRERIGGTWPPSNATLVDVKLTSMQTGCVTIEGVEYCAMPQPAYTVVSHWSDDYDVNAFYQGSTDSSKISNTGVLKSSTDINIDWVPLHKQELGYGVWPVVRRADVMADPGIELYRGQAYDQGLPWVWPEYASPEGEKIRAAISVHPVLQDELDHLLVPTNPDGSPTPDPLNPGPTVTQPENPVYDPPADPVAPGPTEPPVVPPPGTGGSGCPSPMSTDIDFGPLASTGLANKFPFGVIAWMGTTLGGWAGGVSAPEFTVSMAGHNVSINLSLANGAMAIIRAALVIIGTLAMVWWFATALLGLKE